MRGGSQPDAFQPKTTMTWASVYADVQVMHIVDAHADNQLYLRVSCSFRGKRKRRYLLQGCNKGLEVGWGIFHEQ